MVRASTMVRSGDVEREKERMLLDTLPAPRWRANDEEMHEQRRKGLELRGEFVEVDCILGRDTKDEEGRWLLDVTSGMAYLTYITSAEGLLFTELDGRDAR